MEPVVAPGPLMDRPSFSSTWIRRNDLGRVMQVDDIIATSNVYIVEHRGEDGNLKR
ncbi:MAG: hypothetical protein MUO52_19710 [Desulfobacterales bacterium]|nr:hypothetical protein [Desulfobacterales bacterium]